MKTNGKRNKQAGSNLERLCVQEFRKAGFPNVVTCRSESRSRDAQKVDLINKNEASNGRLPYNVQCKNLVKVVKYPLVLSEIPKIKGVTNVIIHNQTEKVNDRFITRDRFAILYMDDFMKMVKELQEYRNEKLIDTASFEDLIDFTEND